MGDKKSKNTNEANGDYEDHTSDYYDANGKIATLRKRRSSKLENFNDGFSKRVKRSNYKNDVDPLGRSYYFSTYRKKDFSPDHWRSQLSKDLLSKIANDTSCNAVLEAFGYPKD